MSENNCVNRGLRAFLGLLVVTLTTALPAWCQDVVTLTFGAGTTTATKAADDFATTVLDDPWDYSNSADLAWQENLTNVSINSSPTAGLLVAKNKANSTGYNGLIYPLFEGFAERFSLNHDTSVTTIPQSGFVTPIDAAKYWRLSFRMRNQQRSNIAIHWSSFGGYDGLFPSSDDYEAVLIDKTIDINPSFPQPHYKSSEWEIYNLDLSNSAQFEIYSAAWGDDITSLAIEPSTDAAANSQTEIDWIRLYHPNPTNEMLINFRYNGWFEADRHIVRLYVDNNNTGYDGTPISLYTGGYSNDLANNPNNLRFLLDRGALPPGQYWLYASVSFCDPYTYDGFGIFPACVENTATRSVYMGPFTVQTPPKITIKSPSVISGPEYSEREMKNRWDMNLADDLLNFSSLLPLSKLGITTQAIVFSADANEGNRVYAATTSRVSSAATTPLLLGDASPANPQIHLTTKTDIAIDTYRYRYLTYRMWLPATIPLPSALEDMSDDKSMVTGPVFWNYDVTDDVGANKPHVVRPGWNTYTVDLWDSYNADGFDWFSDFLGVSHLRIDPVSRRDIIPFKLDWVRLNEENRPAANKKFRISFELSDSDSNTANVQILRDDDDMFDPLDTSTWGFSIATLSALNSGTGTVHSYDWDTTTTPEGAYYLHFVVSDGNNITHKYSSVEVVIESPIAPTPPPVRIPLDYDGDWLSDPVVFRPTTGEYFQKLSGSQPVYYQWVKGVDFYPVEGDFDGDGRSDLALAFPFQGYIGWYIHQSSTNTVITRVWGYEGDQIAIGDYNGNDSDEIAIFRDGIWFILDEQGSGYARYWGQAGDVPVAADYDGDGIDDLAVWRPDKYTFYPASGAPIEYTVGMWWVLNSSCPDGVGCQPVSTQQWGLPGDIPVASDWNLDGASDFAIWRPSTGFWHLLDEFNNEERAQYGLPGDIPLIADFNRDGGPDMNVFRVSEGKWYSNFRNGYASQVQFGLPGDRIPKRVQRVPHL